MNNDSKEKPAGPKPPVSRRSKGVALGLRHDELLQRYEQLSAKYKAAVQSHSHAYSLGHFLLRHSDEGVALLRDGHLAAANHRFYGICAGSQRWHHVGPPSP